MDGQGASAMVDPLLLSETLDSLSEGVQVVAPDWRYLYVNNTAARQGRRSPGELLGKTMHECYPGIERTPMFELLERCMGERSSERTENEFTYEDGRTTWFELRIQPCRAGIVIVSLDMTERRNVESRLQQTYRQALRDIVTPVVRLHEGVLLVPLVGALDGPRAAQMTETVLHRVVEERAKVVLLDVAGVPVVDTAVAGDLLRASAMLRLLGSEAILTGLAPEAAKSIVHLGVDLSTMRTTGQLAEGIAWALAAVGGSAPVAKGVARR